MIRLSGFTRSIFITRTYSLTRKFLQAGFTVAAVDDRRRCRAEGSPAVIWYWLRPVGLAFAPLMDRRYSKPPLLLGPPEESRDFQIRHRDGCLHADSSRSGRDGGGACSGFTTFIKTGGNDGDPNLALHGFIQYRTENDVGFGIRRVVDDTGGFADFV